MLVHTVLTNKDRILALQLLFFFCSGSVAFAQQTAKITWQQAQTRYAIVEYQSFEDLKRLNRCLNYNRKSRSLRQLLSASGRDKLSGIKVKVDTIYERVQEILDMRKSAPKVIIKIYRNRKQLDNAYFEIYQKKNTLRAWYIYEYNAIYLNVKDVHEGVLAHEMAHAIIDHYLEVRPPSASAEILARYVDSHLK